MRTALLGMCSHGLPWCTRAEAPRTPCPNLTSKPLPWKLGLQHRDLGGHRQSSPSTESVPGKDLGVVTDLCYGC